MKKTFFFVTILAVMVICMTACSNSNSKDNTDDTYTSTTLSTEEYIPSTTAPTTEEYVPEIPELSDNFINTALQFIDEYNTSLKSSENLAEEIILQSNNFKDNLYHYLNFYLIEKYGEEIQNFFGYSSYVNTVDVWIHTYQSGATTDCVSYNDQPAVLNNLDPIILSSGVLGDTYSDTHSLAEARIAAYVLLNMEPDEIESICITNNEGKYSYDFTFKNEAFKELSKEILQSLLEQ